MEEFQTIQVAWETVATTRAHAPEVRLPHGAPSATTPPLHPSAFDARPHTRSQSSYAASVHTLDWLALRSSLESDEERAWLHSLSFDSLGSRALRCVPSLPLFQVSPTDFPIWVRHYLDEPQPVMAGIRRCGGCSAALSPGDGGRHYLVCRGGGHGAGNWYSVIHDSIVRVLVTMFQEVFPGRGVVLSEDYVGSQHYSPHHIPDITVLNWDGRGGTLAVEVSCFRPMSQRHLHRAASGPSAASAEVEGRRRRDYGRLPPGTRWVPFVFDHLGHMGPETVRFFSEIARMRRDQLVAQEALGDAAATTSWSELWRTRLSVALARVVSRTIRHRATTDFSAQVGLAVTGG